MNTNIIWIDNTPENLLLEYKDYVDKITNDKSLNIVTNILCLVDYTKPKINNGINSQSKVEYIKTNYKIMTSTLLIQWNRSINNVSFIFGNCTPIKFFKMENI